MPVSIDAIPIAEDADDGSMWLNRGMGIWNPSGEQGNQGFFGGYPADLPYYGYFRFELPVSIPAGATIDSATLSLTGWTTWMWDPSSDALAVEIENASDAEQVQGFERFPPDGLTVLVEATTRWPTDGGLDWASDGINVSPDLASLLQQVVDQHDGLAANAHVQFWLRMDEIEADFGEVGYVEFASSPEDAATLSLEFTP